MITQWTLNQLSQNGNLSHSYWSHGHNSYYKSLLQIHLFLTALLHVQFIYLWNPMKKNRVMKSRGGETPAKLGRHGQVAGDWRKRLGSFRVPKKTLKSRILRKLIKCWWFTIIYYVILLTILGDYSSPNKRYYEMVIIVILRSYVFFLSFFGFTMIPGDSKSWKL